MLAKWINEEFATLDLGDKRRNKRSAIILEQQSHIAESTPAATCDNAKLEATYRLMKNPAVTPDAILSAHREATLRRTAEHPIVVLAHDTTVVDITKPQKQVKGAGPLESENKRGFFIHPLYAMTPEGLVLGIADQQIWTRESIRSNKTAKEKAAQIQRMAFEEKESCRWLEMLQSGEQIARANPGTHYISVSDSESDIYEVLAENNELASNFDFVIRSCHDRRVVEEESSLVLDTLANCEFQHEFNVEVTDRKSLIPNETRVRRKSRSGRMASISVRSRSVTLQAPGRVGGRGRNVTLNVVEAIETNPPSGEEPICWLLFTSLPIETISELEAVLSTYCRRWDIELYFKTLKSGMGIEKLKYESLESYLTATSFLMITAYRVEHLKSANRVCSEKSCETLYERDFWQALYLVAFRGVELPADPPTIGEVLLTIAKLGGYINKKGQGPPGSMTLWRGMRKSEAYYEAFLAFQMLKKDV